METNIKKKVSIIIPVYNEANNIINLLDRLKKITNKLLAYNFYYIFVDDGSTDESLEILSKQAQVDSSIKIISLSRNFGKEIALTAGIESIKNGSAIIIDADLQHPPELIDKMICEWEQGAEIVATIRTNIENRSISKRVGSFLFYKILNSISDTVIKNKTTDFRFLDEKVVTTLQTFTERTRMVRGLIDWMGFKKVYLQFDAPDRQTGEPGYSYKKLFDLAINSLSSFSLFPLKLIGYCGIFIIFMCTLLLTIMLLNNYAYHWTIFTPLAMIMIGNTFLIGVVFCGMGLLALYIGNIHIEVINRPMYIVRQRINFYDNNYENNKEKLCQKKH